MIEIGLLGPFTLVRAGRPIAMGGPRLRALLAVLAMSTREFVSIDAIAAAIWGRDFPEDVRRTVHTNVARLRRMIGEDLVVTQRSGYLLDVDPDRVDALRFLRLTAEAGRATGQTVERELLDSALALWRGTPFQDVGSDLLIETDQPRLVECYLGALERRVDLDIELGRSADLLSELGELTSRYPLREPLWARLIEAFRRSGRPDEAMASYRAIRSRIADQLGVDPGRELQARYAALLAAGAPDGTELPGQVPRQLPTDVATFVGRHAELARLDALSATGTPAEVVAICGAGGIGKTTLAVHWARLVRDRFGPGQLYLNLRGYGPGVPMEPAAALDTLLRSLGFTGQQIPTDVERRGVLLRKQLEKRPMLLLLDNARDAEQVRPLLPATGLVLITSRSRLRGLTARRIVLDQLDVAESEAFLAAALRLPAGSGRAQYQAELAELAELCGHLPLALAIAAERAARRPGPGPVGSGLAATVAELKGQLDRLDALETGDDTAANLRAVFSWSYQELDPDSARAFRLLGLHPGPDLSLPAAAALLGASSAEVRRLLGVLVDGHLVARRRPGRYELHDLLRVYAEELALQVDDDAARADAVDRVENWSLHTAANAHGRLDATPPLVRIGTPRPDVVPLRFDSDGPAASWFDAERQVLAALVQAAATDGRQRSVYELASRMSAYLITRHDVGQLIELDGLALTAAIQAGDRGAEAGTACRLGWNYRLLGDMRQAQIHLERGVELLGSLGDDAGKCTALGSLGVVCRSAGATAQAIGHHQEALAIACKLGDDRLVANRLNNLAMTHLAVGLPADAEEGASKAAEVHRGSGDRRNESHALDTLGLALAAQGRYQEAIACYRRALELAGAIRDRWGEVTYLTNLGVALRDHGDPGQARRSWERALAIMDDLVAVTHGEPSRAQLEALIRSLTTDRDRTS